MAELTDERARELLKKALAVRADFTGVEESFDTWVRLGDMLAQFVARDIRNEGVADEVAEEYGTAVAGVVTSMLAAFGGKDCEALAVIELCVRAGIAFGCYGMLTDKFSRKMVGRAAIDHAQANERGRELDEMLGNL